MGSGAAARRALWGAALVLPLLGACGGGGPERRSVLVVAVDTLRADRLGYAGHTRPTSPRVDALAAEATRFDVAYAPSSWTLPSVASMLTGRYPASHGMRAADGALPADVPDVAALLRAEGFATRAVVGNALVSRDRGFARGFDVFDDTHARGPRYVSSAAITRVATGWLEELAAAPEPFFLFALYYDPHNDYVRHPDVGFTPARAGRLAGDETIHVLRRLDPPPSEAELELVRALYDEEVRTTDAAIGELLDALERLGLADDTAVVFTSDHGEAFRDRGWFGHTRDVTEEVVRVPLVVRDPDVAGAARVDTPVSIVSLAPTILELAGVDGRALDAQAPSLGPWIRGEARAYDAPLLAEVDFDPLQERNAESRAHKRALRVGDHKLIVDDDAGTARLYDLARDPGERVDLAAERPDVLDGLQAALASARGWAAREGRDAAALEMTPEQLETLRALGYLEPGSGSDE